MVNFQPDLIKIDMQLIRGIDTSAVRRAVLAGTIGIAQDLGITLLAEGIETAAGFQGLRAAGIRLFAKPAFEALPPVQLDAVPDVVARVAMASTRTTAYP